MKSLIKFFTRYIELDQRERVFIQQNTNFIEVPKNHSLLKEGEVSKAFYFISKGCARMFYTSNLEEKTAYFYTENSFISSYQSFTKQLPAKHNISSIEPCELAIFDLKSVELFLAFSAKFQFLARAIMEEELGIYQQIISNFITQNAEERYLFLLEEKPELIQRIPQHQIATFLGVTPETLSRIRNRIMSR